MKYFFVLTLLLKVISVATFFSGLIQMLFPGFVLGIVGGDSTPTSLHFFRIVGMFMLLFGGLFFQTLTSPLPSRSTTFWCGFQKFGASLMIGIGVYHGLFATVALAVGGFDFVSAILIAFYWKKI